MQEVGLQIDWRLLALQTLGFLVIFFTLRKFLFGPVSELLESRSEEIAENLRRAAEEKSGAARVRSNLEHQLAQIDEEARRRMDEALAKTNEERDRLLDDTRAHAEALLVRARESIEEERNRALTEVRGEVTDLALLAAGRALADGVSTETHRQVIDDFISGLEKE